jgi:ATP-dependent protease ClpP protease subunit
MSNKPIIIRFLAPVSDMTVNALLSTIDRKMRQGVNKFILLISSPGGSVFHGLSAYNYLKGLPATIITHNFGSIDSIGVVLYCSGERRYSVPHARFLLHGVSASFQNERLEERQLEERLKGLRMDVENIAKVIANTTGNNMREVIKLMHEATTMNPHEAKLWGLVHEIRSELYEPGSEVISIQYQQKPPTKI